MDITWTIMVKLSGGGIATCWCGEGSGEGGAVWRASNSHKDSGTDILGM